MALSGGNEVGETMRTQRIGARMPAAAIVVALVGCIAVLSLIRVPLATAGSYPPVIAYDDRSGIFEVKPGASGTEHLVVPGGYYPTFSPTGNQMAFEAVESTSNGLQATIWIGDRQGRSPHKLISGSSVLDGDPKGIGGFLAWSPDGRKIAYLCQGTYPNSVPTLQLCLVDPLTGHRRLVTDPATFPGLNERISQRLSWSPDSKQVVGDAYEGTTGVAATVINAKTGSYQYLPSGSGHTDLTPSMSPNGRHVVFYEPNVGIGVMKSNGTGRRTIIPDPELLGEALSDQPFPVYSPTGKEILYTAYATKGMPGEGYQQLFTRKADGSGGAEQITSEADTSAHAVWAPILTTCTVPKLKHKTLAKAKKLLRKSACALGKVRGPKSHRGKRQVRSQSIKPNQERPAGTKVDLRVK
jgi:PASTA domain/WD40-like Beta Propeller Repeat